jgi:hypothetical protein
MSIPGCVERNSAEPGDESLTAVPSTVKMASFPSLQQKINHQVT